MAAAQRFLVVGGGLTGAVVARTVLKQCPRAAVTVWEQADHVGGRLTTRCVGTTVCDTSAQYWTPRETSAAHVELLDAWREAGVLRPFYDVASEQVRHLDLTHYTAPQGLKHMVESAFEGSTVGLNRKLARLEVNDDGATTAVSADGERFTSDGVVLAAPPAMLEDVDFTAPTAAASRWAAAVQDLRTVSYSRRYAMTLTFPASDASALRRLFTKAVAYISDDVVRYVSVDGAKRAGGNAQDTQAWCDTAQGSVAVLVHAGIPFTEKCLDANTSARDVEAHLMEALQRVMPELPKPQAAELELIAPSQLLHSPFAAEDSTNALRVDGTGIVFAGDYFTTSNIDGCITSGDHAARLLLDSQE